MSIAQSLLNTIVLLGALQGFIISCLLFRVSETANKCLATLIFLLSLACLNIFLLESQVYNSSEFWHVINAVVPMVIIMPVGPLIYFYVRASISTNDKFSKQDRLHFYPVILDLIPSMLAAAYIIGLATGNIKIQKLNIWNTFIDIYNMYVDIPRWFAVTGYTLAAWRLIKSKEEVLKKTGTRSRLNQIVLSFTIFQAIWLCHLIPYLIPALSNKLLHTLSWYPIYVPLAILVYFLGINGYFVSRNKDHKKIKTNQISIDEANTCIKSLETAMLHELLFLNPTLSLTEVVNHTGINQKMISQVLNQHLGKSFNGFVNEYRITEVKKRLVDPQYNHLTITGIAFESGFNSQATFQRTFRQITGQSPTEFKQLHTTNRGIIPLKSRYE